MGPSVTLCRLFAGHQVNGDAVKMRGFCNHENFAGVGAAVPPRVDLLRVQQLRGVGGNSWRTSHNPPEVRSCGGRPAGWLAMIGMQCC